MSGWKSGRIASVASWAFTLSHVRRTLLLFLLMVGCAWLLMNAVPASFMPVEDKGMFFVDMELHDGSSVNRTKPVLQRAEAFVMAHPAVKHVFSLAGENRRSGGNEANGQLEVILKPWEERKGGGYTVQKVIDEVRAELDAYPEIIAQVSQPPAIAGLGLGSGVDLVLQDLTGTNWEGLLEATDLVTQKANQHPVLTGVASPIKPETPELFLDVNRAESKALGVPLADIYSTLRTFTGSVVVNDFNLYGRVYRVRMQADDAYRERPDALQYFYVRSSSGAMVPLSVVASIDYSTGPAAIDHYNMFRAARVSGDPVSGRSTGEAIKAMREVLGANLPPGIGYEWTGLTAQEIKAAGQAVIAMVLAVVFVYLFLCALYESWTVPLAVLLITPAAIFGALLAVYLRGLENGLFFQVAMVALVGMAAKNSILIVEFAKQLVEQGRGFQEAALEAAKLRFRPIMMTAISFIFGVMPLVLSSGPGAVARQSISTAVLGGMLLATTIGIAVVPLFFVLLGRLDRKLAHRSGDPSTDTPVTGGTGLRRRGAVWILCLIALLAVPGCMVGPDYQQPEMVLPEQWHQDLEDRKLEGVKISDRAWIDIFHDEQLQRAIEVALANNRDLLIAIESIAEARAVGRITRSRLYPTVDVELLAEREEESELTNTNAETVDEFFFGPGMAWELDLWGANRRASRAALADYLAAEYGAQAVRLSC